jgi:hypothetical protein
MLYRMINYYNGKIKKMSFRTENKLIILDGIEDNWSMLKINHEDKSIVLYGWNGKARCSWTNEPEISSLAVYECSRRNDNIYKIQGEATSEGGERFLVLEVDFLLSEV